MKQEDLKNLKIEDLEEVTEGYWPEGEDMIVADNNHIKTIHKILLISPLRGYYKVIGIGENFNKAYKIPQPKMRDMNSLEVMEYLHLLQLYLDGVVTVEKIREIHENFELPYLSEPYPEYYLGDIKIKDNEEKGWCDKAILMQFDNVKDFKFAILKYGITTEFKLPQIEV